MITPRVGDRVEFETIFGPTAQPGTVRTVVGTVVLIADYIHVKRDDGCRGDGLDGAWLLLPSCAPPRIVARRYDTVPPEHRALSHGRLRT